MSDSQKIAEIAADGVADGMHIVGEEALAAEKAVRGLDSARLGFLGLGIAIGGAVGSLIAFKVAYLKGEAKYKAIAEEEIAEMRQHYEDKALSLEAQASKRDLEEIVTEREYVSTETERPESPPMAVAPPQQVVDDARETPAAETTKPTPPVPAEEAKTQNVFRDVAVDEEAEQETTVREWNYARERAKRSPDIPYVIHYDERHEMDGYSDLTLTYYEADDVLCNERDEVIPQEEREGMVGERNLELFGHGSNDPSIVYVRNDRLELVIELIKSTNSYAEEVHGLKHSNDSYRRNFERMRRSRDRDSEDG